MTLSTVCVERDPRSPTTFTFAFLPLKDAVAASPFFSHDTSKIPASRAATWLSILSITSVTHARLRSNWAFAAAPFENFFLLGLPLRRDCGKGRVRHGCGAAHEHEKRDRD